MTRSLLVLFPTHSGSSEFVFSCITSLKETAVQLESETQGILAVLLKYRDELLEEEKRLEEAISENKNEISQGINSVTQNLQKSGGLGFNQNQVDQIAINQIANKLRDAAPPPLPAKNEENPEEDGIDEVD